MKLGFQSKVFFTTVFLAIDQVKFEMTQGGASKSSEIDDQK